MGARTELQSLLESITPNTYFQTPPNIEMVYPCIQYKLDNMSTEFANNRPYHITPRYLVTVIDENPDSLIPKAVAALPMCLMSRAFVANNLYHTVFTLYF